MTFVFGYVILAFVDVLDIALLVFFLWGRSRIESGFEIVPILMTPGLLCTLIMTGYRWNVVVDVIGVMVAVALILALFWAVSDPEDGDAE